jgi:hypothetical protein
MMKRVVLVACASRKLGRAARARELYQSALFRKSMAYAEGLKPDAVFILSAKHGLLAADEVIEPYDVTLGERFDLERDHFIFLAGQRYREFLLPRMRSVELPLEGMGFGKQLQYLTEANR